MTLGEIKAEALRLMFAGNLGYEFDVTSLISDDNYNVYIYAMTGAINRCFADLEAKKVLPIKTKSITAEDMDGNILSLSNIDDYSSMAHITDSEGVVDIEYIRRGNYITLPKLIEGDSYMLFYYPKLERVSSEEYNGNELSVPDELARLIPYFIKGEVYREDDPNEAGEARNWYEYGVEMYMNKNMPTQTSVVSKYSI